MPGGLSWRDGSKGVAEVELGSWVSQSIIRKHAISDKALEERAEMWSGACQDQNVAGVGSKNVHKAQSWAPKLLPAMASSACTLPSNNRQAMMSKVRTGDSRSQKTHQLQTSSSCHPRKLNVWGNSQGSKACRQLTELRLRVFPDLCGSPKGFHGAGTAPGPNKSTNSTCWLSRDMRSGSPDRRVGGGPVKSEGTVCGRAILFPCPGHGGGFFCCC